jgi:hypothetical protein
MRFLLAQAATVLARYLSIEASDILSRPRVSNSHLVSDGVQTVTCGMPVSSTFCHSLSIRYSIVDSFINHPKKENTCTRRFHQRRFPWGGFHEFQIYCVVVVGHVL